MCLMAQEGQSVEVVRTFVETISTSGNNVTQEEQSTEIVGAFVETVSASGDSYGALEALADVTGANPEEGRAILIGKASVWSIGRADPVKDLLAAYDRVVKVRFSSPRLKERAESPTNT